MAWNDLKLGKKLPLVMTILMTLAVGIMSLVSMSATKSIMRDGAIEKLQSVAHIQSARVRSLLEAVERDLVLQANSAMTATALTDFSVAFKAMENAGDDLRRIYITENEHPLGQKDLLVQANTGSSYGFRHTEFHPYFDTLQNDMDYYDIFLFDTSGNLVYSVFKEEDFATNMLTGPWKDTGLAESFRRAMELGPNDPPVFLDFAPYAPSADAPAAFMAIPVFGPDDGFSSPESRILGVMAYQMPIDELNKTTSDLEGLGDTANGFIVGDDHLMRTDSIMTEANDILSVSVDTLAVTEGLAGHSGFHKEIGPLGKPVYAAYVPLTFRDVSWVVFVEQDEDVIFSGLAKARFSNLWSGLGVLAGAIFVSVFFSRSISHPFQRLTAAVKDVASGDLTTEVAETNRQDEVGELARATEVFRQNAIEMEKLNKEQSAANEQMTKLTEEREAAAERERTAANEREEADRLAVKERQKMMLNLSASIGDVVRSALDGDFSSRVSADFDDQVLTDLAKDLNLLMSAVDHGLSETSTTLERVASGDLSEPMTGEFQGAFGKLQGNANHMIGSLTDLIGGISESGATLSSSSGELRQTANALASQAEQNAASVEETSAALVELSASVKQVSENVKGVSSSAQDARSIATTSEKISAEATKSMNDIAEGSKEIARVVDVINDISFQINLLALNAGVEAARAGDAGLGFSVVASEVRQLSHRASDAAKEIAEVIAESDKAVANGVTHVSSAKDALGEIADSVVKISDSIEAVSVAVTEQSTGIGEITASLSLIDGNTQKQAAAFEKVTASSQLLANEATDLTGATSRFQLSKGAVSAGAMKAAIGS